MSTKNSTNTYDLAKLELSVSGIAKVSNVKTTVYEKQSDGTKKRVAERTQTLTFDFTNVDAERMKDVARVLLQELVVKYQNNRARRDPSKWLASDEIEIDVADLLTKQSATIDPRRALSSLSDAELAEYVAAELARRGLAVDKIKPAAKSSDESSDDSSGKSSGKSAAK